MARPRSDKLFYFPLDVTFFSDKKIKALRVKKGAEGIVMYIYCLCQIYGDRYYVLVDDNFIDCAVADLGFDAITIKDIIEFFCERELFDKGLYESKSILTGKSVQLRFQEAHKGAKRDFQVNDKLWLLSPEETLDFINVECAETPSANSQTKTATPKQANKPAIKVTRNSLVSKYGEKEILRREQKYRSWQKKNGISGEISYSAIAKFLIDDKTPEIRNNSSINLDDVMEELRNQYSGSETHDG